MKISKWFSLSLSLGVAAVVILMTAGSVSAGDAAKGEKLAKKCLVCHTLNKGGKNKLGPNLYGVIGRDAGSVPGYKYSKAMISSGIIWDGGAFTEFVTKPKTFIKGTKMSFSGVKKIEQRADLLAYFETLSDTPQNVASLGDAGDGAIAAIKHCTVCHSFEKGGKTVFGPNLFGVYGQPAGAIEGYNYSQALLNAELVWTDATIIEFLADPAGFLKGTKAKFPGVKSAKERADIVAFMKTLQ